MKKTIKTLALISALALSMTACSTVPTTTEPEEEVVVTTVETTVPEETTTEVTTTEETTVATEPEPYIETETNELGGKTVREYSPDRKSANESVYKEDGELWLTTYKEFYDDGTLAKSISKWADGQPMINFDYYPNGNLKYRVDFKDGIMIRSYSYNTEGKITLMTGYTDEKPSVYLEVIDYDSDGLPNRTKMYDGDKQYIGEYDKNMNRIG